MIFNEVALTLAGFVLAHAAWFSADLPAGQRLAPFVVVQRNGERELTRFDQRDHTEAVNKARDFVELSQENADAWAIARQGIFTIDGSDRNVIVIEYWSRGMPEPYTVMQEIRPATRRYKFKIIGPPLVFLDGEIQEASEVDGMINTIMTGVEEHTQAGPLWTQWKNM